MIYSLVAGGAVIDEGCCHKYGLWFEGLGLAEDKLEAWPGYGDSLKLEEDWSRESMKSYRWVKLVAVIEGCD